MEYRVLGRTGLEVSRLGMGGLFVSKVGSEDRWVAKAAIRRALDLGINYIDTAPTYADSEEVIGWALEDVTRPLIVSTKFGGRPREFNPRRLDHLKFSFDESRRLLRRDVIDILMVHEPDRPGMYDWWTDWESFTGPVTEALMVLKEAGLVRHIGLGGTTPYILARICATGQYDVVLTAFNYSLLWGEAAIAVIPEATRQDMGIIVGSPLQQGWLARRFDAELASPPAWLAPPRRDQFLALYALLDDIGMSLPEMALRWVISDPRVHTTLMGARSVAEVESNVAAVEAGPLPDDIMARIAEIQQLVPFRPFHEPFGCQLGNPEYRGPGGP